MSPTTNTNSRRYNPTPLDLGLEQLEATTNVCLKHHILNEAVSETVTLQLELPALVECFDVSDFFWGGCFSLVACLLSAPFPLSLRNSRQQDLDNTDLDVAYDRRILGGE